MSASRLAYTRDNVAAMCHGMINSGVLRAYNSAAQSWVVRVGRNGNSAWLTYQNGDTEFVTTDENGDYLDLVPVVNGQGRAT